MKIAKITPVGKKPVYDISVRDVQHYTLENGVLSHNTGGMYSANQVFIITKSQEKDGTELQGFKFTINVEKSRYVREKAKFPFTVHYGAGINKWSGLLDIAIEAEFVIKPTRGWYSRVDPDTGEIEDKKWREKETNSPEFWEMFFKSEGFHTYLTNTFKLGSSVLMAEDVVVEEEIDETE